jgi:hypothetical protein
VLTLLEQPPLFVIVYRIVAVPADKPVTTPDELTDAVDVFELLQTPPDVASVKVVVLPTQTVFVPPMEAGAAGKALTVMATLPVMVMLQVLVVFIPTTE